MNAPAAGAYNRLAVQPQCGWQHGQWSSTCSRPTAQCSPTGAHPAACGSWARSLKSQHPRHPPVTCPRISHAVGMGAPGGRRAHKAATTAFNAQHLARRYRCQSVQGQLARQPAVEQGRHAVQGQGDEPAAVAAFRAHYSLSSWMGAAGQRYLAGVQNQDRLPWHRGRQALREGWEVEGGVCWAGRRGGSGAGECGGSGSADGKLTLARCGGRWPRAALRQARGPGERGAQPGCGPAAPSRPVNVPDQVCGVADERAGRAERQRWRAPQSSRRAVRAGRMSTMNTGYVENAHQVFVQARAIYL